MTIVYIFSRERLVWIVLWFHRVTEKW